MWKFILFKVSLHTLGRLPLPLLYGLISVLADLVYVFSPKPRRNVWDNLRHVMPAGTPKGQMRATARQVFRNVALYYADLLHMSRMDMDDFFHHRFVFHGFHEHLLPSVRAGKGVIILGAHYGNPELAAQGLIPLGVRVLALTEPLKPASLSRFVDRLRSGPGHIFLPVSIGSVKRVMQTLESGGVVALMADRDIRGPKALLPFCGRETLMPTGPIEVALRTGATVIPAFNIRRRNYTIEAYLEEPLELQRTGDMEADIRAGALRFLERLERHLHADPGQWAVLEAIWEPLTEPVLEPAPAVRGKP